MTWRTALGLVALIGACSDSPTTIVLDVSYDEALRIDELDVKVDGVLTTIAAGTEVTVLLPDSSAGQLLRIEVEGVHAATPFAHGEIVVTPVAGDEVRAGIALVPLTGLVDEGPFAWDSTMAPLVLGDARDRLCFLTQISGALTTAASVVQLSVADGKWTLGTPTPPTPVSAQAHCLRWSAASGIARSDEFVWVQGQEPVDMGGMTNRFCVLTRLAGFFNGGGEIGAALVEAGRWKLRGLSGQTGVAASAHCMAWPEQLSITYADEVHWEQGLPTRILGTNTDRACGLTLVTGLFSGATERVSVTRGGSEWILDGTSGTVAVGSYGRCMSWMH
jgi:hypothetical protein